MKRGLVSCEWLRAELDREYTGDEKPPRLVDATWYLPGTPFAGPEGSCGAQADHIAGPRLPGAVFFDIDGVAAPHPAGLPHMLPSEEMFAAAMAAMGITPTTRVVTYDRHGVFSSPRFWWTLKLAFGHSADVAVLDGGLPRWKELGYPLEDGEAAMPDAPAPVGEWKRVPEAVWDLDQVRANVGSGAALLVDARPAPRFLGSVPEPRPGMRGGHVPGSLSMPFNMLLTGGPARALLPQGELEERLITAGVLERPGEGEESLNTPGRKIMVASCGSGLTACIVGLALHQLGEKPPAQWAVYDGSWAEWGARSDTPIVRQGADGADELVP